jgi:hypothetical protein
LKVKKRSEDYLSILSLLEKIVSYHLASTIPSCPAKGMTPPHLPFNFKNLNAIFSWCHSGEGRNPEKFTDVGLSGWRIKSGMTEKICLFFDEKLRQ